MASVYVYVYHDCGKQGCDFCGIVMVLEEVEEDGVTPKVTDTKQANQ